MYIKFCNFGNYAEEKKNGEFKAPSSRPADPSGRPHYFATFTLTICFRDFVRQTSFQYFILLYLPRPHEISPVPGRGCSSFCRLFDTLGCDYCARSKV